MLENVAGFFFSAKREKKNPFSTFYVGEGNNLLGVPIFSSGIVACNKWCEGTSEAVYSKKISHDSKTVLSCSLALTTEYSKLGLLYVLIN